MIKPNCAYFFQQLCRDISNLWVCTEQQSAAKLDESTAAPFYCPLAMKQEWEKNTFGMLTTHSL